MNLRNVAIYLSILMIVVGCGLLLRSAVTSLQESGRVTFSSASLSYIDTFTDSIDDNNLNLNNITEKSEAGYQEDTLILVGNNSGSSSITDNLANLNVFKSLTQRFINPIKFIFNIPTFLLSLLSLPLEPFQPITILLNLAFYISIIIMIIKELK